MAEKILDDSDQGFGAEETSSLYLSRDKEGCIVLEVEGAVRDGARQIEHIYLSQANVQLLSNALNYYLFTM